MLKSGEMNKRIVIQNPTDSQGSTGEKTQIWNTFATVWAKVKPARGTELLDADQISNVIDTIFIIRKLTGLKRNFRIIYDTQTYQIDAVNDIGLNEGHEIKAYAFEAD